MPPINRASCIYPDWGFSVLFLSCKANAKVKLAKTGHGPHPSTLVICVVQLLFVLLYVLVVCKCVLPSGDNPTAVNKHISYHIHFIWHCILTASSTDQVTLRGWSRSGLWLFFHLFRMWHWCWFLQKNKIWHTNSNQWLSRSQKHVLAKCWRVAQSS
jgi:hypothetical protein